jgi:hypothetical protein
VVPASCVDVSSVHGVCPFEVPLCREEAEHSLHSRRGILASAEDLARPQLGGVALVCAYSEGWGTIDWFRNLSYLRISAVALMNVKRGLCKWQ